MTKLQTCVLVWVLLASVVCGAESGGGRPLTAAEYRAELDRLSALTAQLDGSGSPLPQAFEEVPQSWRVRTGRGEFEISAEGVHRDLRRYEREKDFANASAIRVRIQTLRQDFDEYEKVAPDISTERNDLGMLLARPEFRDIHGPTWLDLLKQKLLWFIIRLLQRMFRSASIPTISRFLVYGVMGLAILALGYFANRSMVWGNDFAAVAPKDVPVSAKPWTVWLGEARSVAAQGKWREAIHLAYWAGISFLEHQGAWKPDPARTPREYLGLLANSSQHREALTVLTGMFELVWYAQRDANDATFSQALAALESLGCR
jgi:Domain of unknown function (DUF4129)